MKISICIPTRGLVFAEVMNAVEKERYGHETSLHLSGDLRIPDSHNQLTQQALDDEPDYVWYVEEDTIPPTGALEALLACHADVACIDYGVSGWGCVTKNTKGEILWCGLGCTLVKREVLEKMNFPYFRVDKALRLNDWTWQDLPAEYVQNKNYGGLDIWFCCEARRLGFTIVQAKGECDHLQLESIGQRGVNGGLHKLATRPKIVNNQILIEGGDQ